MKLLHCHLYISGQLQTNDFSTLAQQGIKTIINNRPDNEEPNQLKHEQAQKLAAEQGIDYHYLPMANGQPLPADLVSNFKAIIDATEQPVLAHCRSGMRSSFIWALGAIAAEEISVEAAIDAGQAAGVPLANARSVLESVAPS